jgi:hypothetical protein
MKIKWFTQIEPLDAETIPWFIDNIDADSIRQILKLNTPPFAVSDHYGSIEQTAVPVLCFPAWLDFLIGFYDRLQHAPDYMATRYAVNFTANKKQINRFLMIKLIGWFNIRSLDYTWSGAGSIVNMQPVWDEYNLEDIELRRYMCAPVDNLESKFFADHTKTVNNDRLSTGHAHHGKFSVKYWNSWFRELYSNSAISLIAEDIQFQKAALFTEKTVWAMMAQTFPIWIGGYNQAKSWQAMGFDIFEDVIDHSYQTADSLWERCYLAFRLNHRILQDLDQAQSLRQQCKSRLQANRDLVFNGVFKRRIQELIAQQSTPYTDMLNQALVSYTNRMHQQASSD